MQEVYDPVAASLRQLRRYVIIGCWVVALSVMAQVFVWVLASFTELRFNEIERVESKPALVVDGNASQSVQTRTGSPLPASVQEAIHPPPIFVRSNFDHFFSDITSLSLVTGTLGLLVLLLLMVLGTIVMTTKPMIGVGRVISTSVWAIFVTAVALPASAAIDMPWKGSGLRTYDQLIGDLDASMASADGLSFYLGNLAMSLMSLVGVLVVGSRYCSGIKSSLPSRLPFIDPELEAEASGIRATSLHGGSAGSAGGALERLVEASREREMLEEVANQTGPRQPSASAVSPGTAPKRVI